MAVERKFIAQNVKEFLIKKFVSEQLSRVGLSDIKLQRTPLGDKILISASRPGLVVGRAGSNIQKLTTVLKEEFNLENPQIEIEEVSAINLDANIIAEMIVNSLERFGSARFKGVGHRALNDVMTAGALGVEILISGKIPSQRARTWRFYKGYLKKSGDIAIVGVNVAYKTAVIKSGAVGVKVSIMPPTTVLPDKILLIEPEERVEEVTDKKVIKEMDAVVGAGEKIEDAKAEDVKTEGSKPAPSTSSNDEKVVESDSKKDVKNQPEKNVQNKATSKSKVANKVEAEVKVDDSKVESPKKDVVKVEDEETVADDNIVKAESQTPAEKEVVKSAPDTQQVEETKDAKTVEDVKDVKEVKETVERVDGNE